MTRFKRLGLALGAVVALLVPGSTTALASTIDFSYKFTNPTDPLSFGLNTVVTGSFEGTLDASGLFFTNITNIVVPSLPGPLYIANYFSTLAPTPGYVPHALLDEKVYFNRESNNFIMLNCQPVPGPSLCASTAFFMLRNGNNGGDQDAVLLTGGAVIAEDRTYGLPGQGSPWSLTVRAPATVPEPTTLLLLGTGIAAVAARRRFNRA